MDDNITELTKLFGREKSIHEILGGGEVANVLLWRDKTISGAIFVVVTIMWFLLEVAEYTLVTFLCHLTITAMLIIFIWSNAARSFKWTPPKIPNILLEESSMLYHGFCENLNFFLSKLLYIACGNDFILFCVAILSISMLSTIGTHITTTNLLFIGFLAMGTLPYLYENNEEAIDYHFDALYQSVFRIYEILGILYKNVISKIPKWPLKEKKFN